MSNKKPHSEPSSILSPENDDKNVSNNEADKNTISNEKMESETTIEPQVAELEKLKKELEKTVKDNYELKDKYLRALAESENFKKRKQEEIIGIRKFALEIFITELLPVIDNFKRAFIEKDKADSLDKSLKIIDGLKMIQSQLENILTKYGLEKFESVNTKFNPELHNAIQCDEVTDEKMDGIVTDECQSGYKLAGKVIRTAMVKVGKLKS